MIVLVIAVVVPVVVFEIMVVKHLRGSGHGGDGHCSGGAGSDGIMMMVVLAKSSDPPPCRPSTLLTF